MSSHRRHWRALAAAVLLVPFLAAPAGAGCSAEPGYSVLYNGSTAGWSQAGPGGFTNSGGVLTSYDGLGMLWYSAEQFGAYSLKLDWRVAGDDNSGVVVGFPPTSDPWVALNNGYEVQIDATDTPDHTTGAIYGFKPADQPARDAALKPPGQWNTYELLVQGERLQVYLNGTRINDFTNTDPARSLTQGHIGLQNHGPGDDVSYRDIRIKRLSPPQTPPVEAESYTSQSGVQPAQHTPASGGLTAGFIENGDWTAYSFANTAGATALTARISSAGSGGQIQVRSGSPTGPLLGTVTVPVTGNWETFQTVSTPLSGTATGPLYLVFTGGGGFLFDVDTFTLTR